MSSALDDAATASREAALNDKPRLTEQEKKNNHIASEQKRRQAIREGFDEMADIVPGLRGQGRSEAVVLQGATAHVRRLLSERYKLLQEARRRGVDTKSWDLDDTTLKIAAGVAAAEDRGR